MSSKLDFRTVPGLYNPSPSQKPCVEELTEGQGWPSVRGSLRRALNDFYTVNIFCSNRLLKIPKNNGCTHYEHWDCPVLHEGFETGGGEGGSFAAAPKRGKVRFKRKIHTRSPRASRTRCSCRRLVYNILPRETKVEVVAPLDD